MSVVFSRVFGAVVKLVKSVCVVVPRVLGDSAQDAAACAGVKMHVSMGRCSTHGTGRKFLCA